ncbi:MAG: B12-binding domain-containing radical SAM protein [Nitrospira sp.]|nr:B12-binding domain-containing radical SAM protein [bacterium]MBL7049756.1 B12-binding domain-containing radical SAM protein [Nitrospira sp.]
MKILLILPKHAGGFLGGVSSSGKAGFARLSLTALAAVTPENIDVRILDARVEEVDYNASVDLVGITGLTSEIPNAYEMADGFRSRGTKVVMGGVHVSALPDEALLHADSVVVGEAELVWKDLIEDFRQGYLKKIYKADDFIDMNTIAAPRRSLLNRDMYTSFSTLQATRGCPFKCDFCTVTTFFGNTYRQRPVEDVVNEVKGLSDSNVVFLDDNIVGKPKYAKELMKALIPLKIKWGSQGSITIAKDDELLSLYAQSGGQYIFIGFESISAENLDDVQKSWNTIENYEKAINKIHDAGIDIIGSFILGLDQDDKSSFRKMLNFLIKSGIDCVMFHVLTPLPGTKLYDKLENDGRIIDRNWAKYHTGAAVFKPALMTPEELQEGYYWIYREFYSYPNMLKRILRSPKNLIYRAAINLSYRRKAMKLPKPKLTF